MEIKEFAEKVCTELERRLGHGYRLERRDQKGSDGAIWHGIMVIGQGCDVAPAICLDRFFEAYESGLPFEGVIQSLLDACRKEGMEGPIDMGFFRSFKKVRDRICYSLVDKARNSELLEDIPYIEFLDLAICFYYAYHGESLGDGTILVHNSHLELWDTCTAELFGLAKRNTQRLFPWVCNSIAEVLGESAGEDESSEEADEEAFLQEIPMQVLSNDKRTQGAVCMLYPDVLDTLSGKGKRDFFILPSSVHEVILLEDTGAGSIPELKKMVTEVNATQVAPEEVLSDSLYYYDSTDKRVKIIF